MITRIPAILIILLISTSPPVQAKEWQQAYPTAKLQQEQPRFSRRINELYIKGIEPFLSAEQKRAFTKVQFEFPLHGTNGQDPSQFYSYRRGNRAFVTLPVLSLIFLEDLSTAYAWLWANNYRLETIDEYITMLKYKSPKDFPGGHYPNPLQALHIPKNALKDRQVDDLSLRFRNTAYAFILLHELGHVLFQHRGYQDTPRAQSRQDELAADQFALDVLRKTSTIPMGAILYFQAQAYFMPNKGQLIAEGRIKSERDWHIYLEQHMTHPLTHKRLEAMALHMSATAKHSRSSAERETLQYIASRLINISDILQDSDLQACMAVVAARANPAILAPRHSRDKTKALFEKSCQK